MIRSGRPVNTLYYRQIVMDSLNKKSFLPRIVFKLKSQLEIPGDNAKEITRYLRRLQKVQWMHLFLSCPHISIDRLFCTLKSFEIASLVRRAKQMDSSYKDPELPSYFVLVSADEKVSGKALVCLQGMDEVEMAYLQGGSKGPSTLVKKKMFLGRLHT